MLCNSVLQLLPLPFPCLPYHRHRRVQWPRGSCPCCPSSSLLLKSHSTHSIQQQQQQQQLRLRVTAAMAQLLRVRAAPHVVVLVLVLLLPFLLLLLLLGAAGAEEAATTTTTAAASSPTPTLVFLLAGQSNMGGRGGATNGTWDGVVPPDCAPSPRIRRLSPSLRWEEAREPLHAGIDLHNVLGVGPGMPFAHALLRSWRSGSGSRRRPAGVPPHAVVGLVPCAQGATAIANWSRGTPLYDRMLARARAAVADASNGSAGRPRLAALLWYQGEADTIRRQDADVYTSRMEAFVRDVRRDLGMPDLLVIQVGLATGQGKFVDIVRDAQRRVSLHNVKYVDAKGLPVATDYTHLTTPAQVQLGKMLAASYLAATLS